jgi:hypothetical protein
MAPGLHRTLYFLVGTNPVRLFGPYVTIEEAKRDKIAMLSDLTLFYCGSESTANQQGKFF